MLMIGCVYCCYHVDNITGRAVHNCLSFTTFKLMTTSPFLCVNLHQSQVHHTGLMARVTRQHYCSSHQDLVVKILHKRMHTYQNLLYHTGLPMIISLLSHNFSCLFGDNRKVIKVQQQEFAIPKSSYISSKVVWSIPRCTHMSFLVAGSRGGIGSHAIRVNAEPFHTQLRV